MNILYSCKLFLKYALNSITARSDYQIKKSEVLSQLNKTEFSCHSNAACPRDLAVICPHYVHFA